MISKPIKGILEEFDIIFEQLKNDHETKHHLEKVSSDVSYLKLWREELESGKQSVFVVGKMSAGKSTFLNFLLDNSNQKEDIIFKTATSTETGLIQTLEHCNNKSESFAKIGIKSLREFKKLTFPPNIRYYDQGSFFSIPLDNTDQIGFFRDKIIAKSKKNSFDTILAIDQVDIKYPLKYFKNLKIIDTPGLGAHEEKNKDTDKIVRTNYHGKSHIFWFLNASKRTMSDNLTLLVDEKELLRKNYERVHFIANQYDEQIKDDDNETIYDKKSNAKRIKELCLKIKTTLEKTINITVENPSIIFTSFKNPHKYNKYLNTISDIQKLEAKLILDKKETSYNNINSLLSAMKPVLEKLKKYVVEEEKQKLDKKIFDLNYQKKEVEKESEISQKKKEEVLVVIDRCVQEIINIKKDKNLNTHERYNTFLRELKKIINSSANKIDNALKRIDNIDKCKKVSNQLNTFKFIKDLSLKENESFLKKYFVDNELDKKKKDLKAYIPEKLKELNDLKIAVNKRVNNSSQGEKNKLLNAISKLEKKKRNIENNSKIINSIKSKINNINRHLLDDLEFKISEWNPILDSENSSLISFLQLYSLLEEHDLVVNKIN